MADLPKTVAARLREQSRDVIGEHLDPNLLAAFAEHTLLEQERSAVMVHLAGCAVCRESLALAFPAAVEHPAGEGFAADRPAGSRRLMPARPVWGWIWRWIAPTALLACAVATASIYYRARRVGERAASPATATVASKAASPPTPESPPQVPEMAKEFTPPPVVSERRAAGGAAKLVKQQAQVRPEQELVLRRATAPTNAVEPRAKEPAVRLAGVPESKTKPALAGRSAAANAPATQPAQVTVVIPSPPPAESRQLHDLSADSLKTQATGAPEAAPRAQAAAAAPPPSSAPVAPPPSPSPPAASQTVEVSPTARFKAARQPLPSASLGRFSAAGANQGANVLPAALWSIESLRDPSGDVVGRVQRSLDGGKTWQPVRPADGVDFRAIAAIGPEIWAGGSPGALFHSSDAGAHWAEIRVEESGHRLSGAIRSINAADAARIAITTDAGQKWLTTDAGRHWKLKPE